MTEALAQLLAKMHASREALAQQLDELSAKHSSLITSGQKSGATSKGIGIVVGGALAVALLLRRHTGGRKRPDTKAT
jgi:hypothetical protein